ncbi:phosphotransferase [Psychrobacillus sp. FSL K6-2836]|uniref:phosphotransferase n=1 Tax=Psychrobacillus sp. FSL K6-2836 TaxID=2921548 RepID=UPI0030FA4482
MTCFTTEDIRGDIFEAITTIFGFNILDFSPIELGYMNLKWKIKTDIGDLFVKQYNKTRYPEQMLHGLETSLILQSKLHKKGTPCPKLYSHKEKYVIHSLNGERFVLMELCEGKNIQAGTANEEQMYSLGKKIGEMHKILNSNNTVQLSLHWDVRSKENMLKNWHKRWDEAARLECTNILSNLEIQRKILEGNDLDIFSDCEKGWGHWDLFVDNILFNTNSVTAILDFDRMNFIYPEFDISRPILSCCVDNGQIHIDKVYTFVQGYREYHKLTLQKLVRSIKLTWWKEAEWVRAIKVQNSSPLKRFNEENIWIGENWDDLESIFSKLI